ncbi:class I SAM-dependent methyltransferase [Frankia sp. AvcI1]|uniref:class I SAM-dependent methyltransferase n=1 Tax=Frankia sp. AvcI1 TaxID=573496 RepID=UPI0002FDDA5F|nr:class I SAM-dependent methyltransferase [Frankia sp. AvcI1]
MSFDRIADRYDATRGGEERGRLVAEAVAAHLPGRRLLEIGVGTGLISHAFAARGRSVVGVDLSARMLAQARGRLPGRIVRADAAALPLRTATVDACLAVHVLHLVGDPDRVLAEVARVLRPGGRLAVVGAGQHERHSDVTAVLRDLDEALRAERPRRDRPELLLPAAQRSGLRLVEEFSFAREERETLTPAEARAQIESRVWSTLWDLSDRQWATIVEPAVAALRRLPDPDRPRPGGRSFHAMILRLADGGGRTAEGGSGAERARGQ